MTFILMFFYTPARAGTVGFETTQGQDLSINRFSGDGDFHLSEGAKDLWDWNVSAGLTKSYDTTQTPAIVDRTTDYSGGLGWTSASKFGLAAEFQGSNSTEENLTEKGGDIEISQEFDLSRPKKRKKNPKKKVVAPEVDIEEPAEDFKPNLKAKLSLANLKYAQTFSKAKLPRRKGRVRAVMGDNTLDQRSIGLDLRANIIEKWSFDVAYVVYGFNKSVSNFENYLDSTAALRRGMSGIAGTVGGVPANTLSFEVSHYFGEIFKIDFNQSYSVLAAAHNKSGTSKLALGIDLSSDWVLTPAVEYDTSSTTQWLGIAGVEWRWD
jgi:hypothetical protein